VLIYSYAVKVTFPINNAAVQQYAASRNGAITLSLIREFLSFYNMQFTLSVFDPESCENTSYNHLSRKNLASELKMTNENPDEPLLHTLLTELLQLKSTSPSAAESVVNNKEKAKEKPVKHKGM
jgi:FGFR1 oncogene partner